MWGTLYILHVIRDNYYIEYWTRSLIVQEVTTRDVITTMCEQPRAPATSQQYGAGGSVQRCRRLLWQNSNTGAEF